MTGRVPLSARGFIATRSRVWQAADPICSACRRHRARRIIVETMGRRAGFERSLAARVEGVMSEKIYEVPSDWAKRAWADQARYQEMYARSVTDPNGFWAEQARRIGWIK